MVHVGVDLHKQVSQVAVLTEEGEITQTRLENDPELVEGFFRKIPPAKVAIEASGTWWWLVDLLEDLGHQPVLSHPKQTKAIASARLKNDKVDAERLALLLRGDLLPTVWIPPREIREARELVRHRVHLIWMRTTIKNQLHALLARRNLRPSSYERWMTQRGLKELRSLELGSIPRRIREDCLHGLQVLDEQIERLEDELDRRWAADPRVRRLVTVPGIGAFIATLLVVELGEIDRFPTAKHMASYVGLTPRIRASANRLREGHISKEGNRLVRWALVVAATTAARCPGPLRAWHGGLAKRRGKKIARVALARRMTEIVYQIWKEEIDFIEVLRRSGVRG
jgi:transposase